MDGPSSRRTRRGCNSAISPAAQPQQTARPPQPAVPLMPPRPGPTTSGGGCRRSGPTTQAR
eukprot:2118345-Pyramimonas_sp.AAC.1